METELVEIKVICWDGRTYTRQATKCEIDRERKAGHVRGLGYKDITFDFS